MVHADRLRNDADHESLRDAAAALDAAARAAVRAAAAVDRHDGVPPAPADAAGAAGAAGAGLPVAALPPRSPDGSVDHSNLPDVQLERMSQLGGNMSASIASDDASGSASSRLADSHSEERSEASERLSHSAATGSADSGSDNDSATPSDTSAFRDSASATRVRRRLAAGAAAAAQEPASVSDGSSDYTDDTGLGVGDAAAPVGEAPAELTERAEPTQPMVPTDTISEAAALRRARDTRAIRRRSRSPRAGTATGAASASSTASTPQMARRRQSKRSSSTARSHHGSGTPGGDGGGGIAPGDDPAMPVDAEPRLKYSKFPGRFLASLDNDTMSALTVTSRFLAVGTHWGVLHILDLEGNVVKRFHHHTMTINAIGLDRNDEYIATAADDGIVAVRNLYNDDLQQHDQKRRVMGVALDPEYAKRSTRPLVCGGMAETVSLLTRGWFGIKDVAIHAGEGPIYALAWHGHVLAWANEAGVRFYDVERQQLFGFVPRAAGAPRADLYRPHIVWRSPATVVVAWADAVSVMTVHERSKRDVASGLSHLQLELVSSFVVSGVVSGIAPMAGRPPWVPRAPAAAAAAAAAVAPAAAAATPSGAPASADSDASRGPPPFDPDEAALMLLIYPESVGDVVRDVTRLSAIHGGAGGDASPRTGEPDEAPATPGGTRDGGSGRRRTAQPTEIHVVTLYGVRLAEDVVPLAGHERFRANDYRLAYAPIAGLAPGLGGGSAGGAGTTSHTTSSTSLNAATAVHGSNDGLAAAAAGTASLDTMTYYIVSPRDIVVTQPRDMHDHIQWLVENKRYREAVKLAQQLQSEAGGDSDDPNAPSVEGIVELGQRYLEDLWRAGDITTLVVELPRICLQSPERWATWIYRLSEGNHLSMTWPVIPVENPQLDTAVYDMVLDRLRTHDRTTLSQVLKAWPPELYNAKQLLAQFEMDHPTPGASDPQTVEIMRDLYHSQGDWAKVFLTDLRLGRRHAMDHVPAHHLYDLLGAHVVDVLAFDRQLIDKEDPLALSIAKTIGLIPDLAAAASSAAAVVPELALTASPTRLSSPRLLAHHPLRGKSGVTGAVGAAAAAATAAAATSATSGQPRPPLSTFVAQLAPRMPGAQTLVRAMDRLALPDLLRRLADDPFSQYVLQEALWQHDPSDSLLGPAEHDRHVALLATYAPSLLGSFLRVSSQYNVSAAAAICGDKDLVSELVYLMGCLGNSTKALDLMLVRLGDLPQAIAFCAEKNDPELWELFATRCLECCGVYDPDTGPATRPLCRLSPEDFGAALLENLDQVPDPAKLLARLPSDLRIAQSGPRLRALLAKARTNLELDRSCGSILGAVVQQRAAHYVALKRHGIVCPGRLSDRADAAVCRVCVQSLDRPAPSAAVLSPAARSATPAMTTATVTAPPATPVRLFVAWPCGHLAHATCWRARAGPAASFADAAGPTPAPATGWTDAGDVALRQRLSALYKNTPCAPVVPRTQRDVVAEAKTAMRRMMASSETVALSSSLCPSCH